MAKYIYPAIFHADQETGGYFVEFPDWVKVNIGAYTDGKNYVQARFMAEDLLGLLCWNQELEHKECPPPSNPKDLFIEGHMSGNFVEIINTDTDAYGRIIKIINRHKHRHHYRHRQIHKAVEMRKNIPLCSFQC